MGEAAYIPGCALQVGIQRKLASKLHYCCSVGMECVPVLMDTLSGRTDDMVSMIRAIGRAISQRAGPPDTSAAVRQLFGWLGITMWVSL